MGYYEGLLKGLSMGIEMQLEMNVDSDRDFIEKLDILVKKELTKNEVKNNND